jgi:hypothetical protein
VKHIHLGRQHMHSSNLRNASIFMEIVVCQLLFSMMFVSAALYYCVPFFLKWCIFFCLFDLFHFILYMLHINPMPYNVLYDNIYFNI